MARTVKMETGSEKKIPALVMVEPMYQKTKKFTKRRQFEDEEYEWRYKDRDLQSVSVIGVRYLQDENKEAFSKKR